MQAVRYFEVATFLILIISINSDIIRIFFYERKEINTIVFWWCCFEVLIMTYSYHECMGMPFIEIKNEPTLPEVVELMNETLKAYETLTERDPFFDELEALILEYPIDDEEFEETEESKIFEIGEF